LKVVFVNRYFYPDYSATSQLLADLAFHLAESERDVHVVCTRQLYDDPAAGLPPQERVRGVTVHRVWSLSHGRYALLGRALSGLTFLVGALYRLLVLVRAGDIVVVKTDPPMLSVVGAIAARVRGARLINWLQNVFPESAARLGVKWAGGPAGALMKWARNASWRVASANIVLGDRMADEMLRLGLRKETIAVIHNWSDGEAIRPLPRYGHPLRERWGVAGKFVVGYSGNMGRSHEFDAIVKGAALLKDLDDVQFVFIGAGTHRDVLEREFRDKGVRNASFHPYQPREELGRSLTLPDAHLVSFRPELEGLGVPSKFYGIAAAGRPVIFIGDLDGEIAGIVRRARCGFAVALGDARGFKDAVLALRDDPGLCARQGANARRVFEERFDKPIALAAWREVLSR
jgi:colanic acid biosynthesis glycosyl transferase WcaI